MWPESPDGGKTHGMGVCGDFGRIVGREQQATRWDAKGRKMGVYRMG